MDDPAHPPAWHRWRAAARAYRGHVSAHSTFTHSPAEFETACRVLRAVAPRSEVTVTEIPAPGRLAPHAIAFSAEIAAPDNFGEDIEELATGRLVVLFDADAPAEWNGRFRLVSYVRAELEREIGHEPMIAQVAWSWLVESLEGAGCGYRAEGGTVTRVLSESFASLAARPASVDLEVRASWTPSEDAADLGPHFEAWLTMLSTVAGLPPLPEGVSAMPGRRR